MEAGPNSILCKPETFLWRKLMFGIWLNPGLALPGFRATGPCMAGRYIQQIFVVFQILSVAVVGTTQFVKVTHFFNYCLSKGVQCICLRAMAEQIDDFLAYPVEFLLCNFVK